MRDDGKDREMVDISSIQACDLLHSNVASLKLEVRDSDDFDIKNSIELDTYDAFHMCSSLGLQLFGP